VRRDAFEAVGGFDPAYAPAYYEDVDLCFALSARGMPAVYEPRSRVVHARGASSPQERALALVLRNRAIFRSRWRARLAGRPELPVPLERGHLLALRDAVASARILVLADRVPEPNEPAGRLTGAIARGWPGARVSLVAPEAGGPIASASMRDLGVEAVAAGPDWLAERPGHYDVVIRAGRSDAARALEAAAAASQARAARIEAPGASRLAELAAAPAAAEPRAHAAARAAELRRLAEADAVLVGDGEEGRLVRAFAGRPAHALTPGWDGAAPPRGLVAALAAVGVAPPAGDPAEAA
jgi:hypothetical protein